MSDLEPPGLSKEEIEMYYYGLLSRPHLVARTGSNKWETLRSRAYYRPKILRIAGEHEIEAAWEATQCNQTSFLTVNVLLIFVSVQY